MATSTKTDFKIYNPEFQSGLWERQTQILNAFNAASRGTIVMVSEAMKGEYEKNAFFKNISDLVERRDPTSTASVDGKKLEQGERVAVKVNRRIGPVEYTMDSLRKSGVSDQDASFILGEMVAEHMLKDMLNTSVIALEAALSNVSANIFDATGESSKTLQALYLIKGMAKLGDQAERVAAWVAHSKPYFDLVGDQAQSTVTNIADRVIYNAVIGTINRPTVISDIPALHDDNASATDTYHTLGLTPGAVTVKETELVTPVTEVVTGLDNLVVRMQGEYAFNLEVKGFAYNVAGGGANPNDSALGTAGNWTKIAASDKDLAGIMIKTQ